MCDRTEKKDKYQDKYVTLFVTYSFLGLLSVHAADEEPIPLAKGIRFLGLAMVRRGLGA